MDFKDIIKTNRSKLGLTLDDIARYVGVSGATVSRWESGDIENIRRDKIAKLAEILRVTPSYLMGWENDSGEQDLVLTALDVAKSLKAPKMIVYEVMEDMGWPDATNPEILSKISAEVERRKALLSIDTGETETYQPWTQADETILRLGGFQAVAEFHFLSEADKAEALKDIKRFVEFTLSKYEERDNSQSPSQLTPPAPDDADTTPPPDAPETPPEGE